MIIARVLGKVISTDKHAAYRGKPLLVVQKLDLDNQPVGNSTIAIDYVGAGEGDTVLVGAAPGLASKVFGIPPAPLRELIMAIVDKVEAPGHEPFGVDLTRRSGGASAHPPVKSAAAGSKPRRKSTKARKR